MKTPLLLARKTYAYRSCDFQGVYANEGASLGYERRHFVLICLANPQGTHPCAADPIRQSIELWRSFFKPATYVARASRVMWRAISYFL
jgi:hypothetical protein